MEKLQRIHPQRDQDILDLISKDYHECFEADIRLEWSDVVRRLAEDNRSQLYVLPCTEKGDIRGFSIVTPLMSANCLYVDYLCVPRRHQRGGAGRRMLHLLRGLGYPSLLLDCKRELMAFYQKIGFDAIAPVLWQSRVPLHLMKWGAELPSTFMDEYKKHAQQ